MNNIFDFITVLVMGFIISFIISITRGDKEHIFASTIFFTIIFVIIGIISYSC